MSELTVFFLSLIWRVLGTMAGMFLFHHKTTKTDFQVVIFLIVLLDLVLLYHLLT